MIFDRPDDAQLDVGQGTDGQRHPRRGQAAHQGGIAERGVAVVDAPHLQDVERLAHVVRGPLLAGVRHGQEALGAGPREDLRELARRMVALGRIETDGHDAVAVGQRRLQGGHGLFGAAVAQEAENQPRADAEPRALMLQGAGDALDRGREGHPAGLRIEEDLGVQHALAARAFQIGTGQLIEIALAAQHVHALIVEIEEVLQVAEVVGGAQGLDRVVRQGDAVSLGQGEGELRLQAALDVEVQLGLGQAVHKIAQYPISLPVSLCRA